MAVPRKLVVVPNTATRELWRIVDSGDLDELEAVLRRAEINARNEHGMTALMRAAYHGRVQMVRVLLEHGADPNVTRNDNFTALSLAAFFGHAEIVDILIGHGANPDVSTRFNTSPYIWAKARSFSDVARALEKRSAQPKRPALKKPVTPVRVAMTEPPRAVVRTLKDPPEIWDLVQEAPKKFDARAAFLARMGSLKARFAVVIALLVVIGAGISATLYLKNQKSVVSGTAPAAATITAAPAVLIQTTEPTRVVPETPIVATGTSNHEIRPNSATRRSRPFTTARTIQTEIINEQAPVETDKREVTPPLVVPARPEPQNSAAAVTKKPAKPLSSQMLSTPKTNQPKAKVIQWP